MEIPPIQLPIAPIQTAFNPIASVFTNQVEHAAPVAFKDLLSKAAGELNQSQLNASQAATDLATGRADNLHDVVLSMEQAGLALQYAIQIRNKLLDSYQEIVRMSI